MDGTEELIQMMVKMEYEDSSIEQQKEKIYQDTMDSKNLILNKVQSFDQNKTLRYLVYV